MELPSKVEDVEDAIFEEACTSEVVKATQRDYLCHGISKLHAD